MITIRLKHISLGILLAVSGGVSQAQEPLKLVVGLPPGGNFDIIARLVADKLRVSLSQQVIVENRPGAQARMANQLVKAAPPDGNTLVVAPGATIYLYPLVFKQLGYDPFNELTPVAQLPTWELGLAVPASSPAKTLADFLTWSEENPDKAFYGTPSAGSIQHFLGVSLAQNSGVKLEHIGYKGASEVTTALIGAQIPAAILNIGEMLQLEATGKVRILATFGPQRAPELPTVPTAIELGLKVPEAQGWGGIYAPANTPQARIDQLNAAIVKALHEPDLKERLNKMGMQPAGR
ncbi:MAG: tripartite tricarboxylate transporter substrate-binding protein [Pigmentiphaga sp.]